MKVRTRFIRSVIKTAQTEEVRMPWNRGVVREVNAASRRNPVIAPKLRTA